ncbi:hypothetical protein HMPREF1556_01603 [Porphyromonas sp. oral taxon 278 str. W7784]|nr:hypothetical protein HMPREF1556_01603 [Porphyromonas sp. oral taxon 278 str. W7784]
MRRSRAPPSAGLGQTETCRIFTEVSEYAPKLCAQRVWQVGQLSWYQKEHKVSV